MDIPSASAGRSVAAVATTVIGLYVAGALITVACLLEFAQRASVGRPVPRRNLYAIMGGALWPILLLGALQVAALISYDRRRQHKLMESTRAGLASGVAQLSDVNHNPPILRSAFRSD